MGHFLSWNDIAKGVGTTAVTSERKTVIPKRAVTIVLSFAYEDISSILVASANDVELLQLYDSSILCIDSNALFFFVRPI
jgi:hypothetical protein